MLKNNDRDEEYKWKDVMCQGRNIGMTISHWKKWKVREKQTQKFKHLKKTKAS